MKSLVFFLLLFASEIALACAVCGFSNEKSQWAFIVTTGILTVVPLCFIGGVVFYFFRQVKNFNYDE